MRYDEIQYRSTYHHPVYLMNQRRRKAIQLKKLGWHLEVGEIVCEINNEEIID